MSKQKNEHFTSWNKALKFRLTVFVVLVSLFWGIAIMLSVFYIYQNRIEAEYRKNAITASKIAASMLRGGAIDHYLQTLEKDEEYERTLSFLKDLHKATGVTYIYITRPVPEGEIFIFDTDEEEPVDFGKMEDWDEDDLNIKPNLLRGERVEPNISITKWGWLLTSREPILRADGSVTGYANADVDLEELLRERRMVFILLGVIITVILFVSFVINLYTIQKFVISPVRMLVKGVSSYHPAAVLPDFFGRSKLDPSHEFKILEHAIIDMDSRIKSMLIEVKVLEEKAEEVYYDALTGIYNRRFLDESLSRIIKTLSRSNSMLSVIMIDIDCFKQYNDTYGHREGDNCLKTVSETISKTLSRSSDFIARYGGEEFTVVLPNTDGAGAQFIAEKLLENIRKAKIPHRRSQVAEYVTISVGATTGKVNHTQNGNDYIKKADEMLYKSKQGGRNRFYFAALKDITESEA
jgi:diguanylate cyclase (GGDEF)-like protein